MFWTDQSRFTQILELINKAFANNKNEVKISDV